MSLSSFSSVLKARLRKNSKVSADDILWKHYDAILGPIHQMQLSMGALSNLNTKVAGKGKLAREASLLIQDLKKNEEDQRAHSKFRVSAMTKAHNVSVVTEETLKRHWLFYQLPIPKVDGEVVKPGRKAYEGARPKGLMLAFIIWYNTKYTSRGKTSLEYFTNKSQVEDYSGGVTGVRFPSTFNTTSKVMKDFLKFCGLNDEDYKNYGKNFEIGHIESQRFIRTKLSNNTENAGFYTNSFIDKIIKLHEWLDLASSSLIPQYSALTGAVIKDTSDPSNIFVNVEMQLKDNSDPIRAKRLKLLTQNTNQGSGALSSNLGFSAALADLTSTLVTNEMGKPEERRELQATSDQIAKTLEKMNVSYNKYYTEVKEALHASFPSDKAQINALLRDLKSSKTIKEYAIDRLTAVIGGNKPPVPIKVSHKDVKVKDFSASISELKALDAKLVQLTTKAKGTLNKLKTSTKPKTSSTPKRRNGPAADLKSDDTSKTYSLSSLQSLINTHLQHVISANMGDGNERRILNYRTGRLAGSASVERMSESREGMITAFYTYMKNPYATFSEKGKQQYPKTRDPKLLIGNAIKEIAATQVGARLRAVVI